MYRVYWLMSLERHWDDPCCHVCLQNITKMNFDNPVCYILFKHLNQTLFQLVSIILDIPQYIDSLHKSTKHFNASFTIDAPPRFGMTCLLTFVLLHRWCLSGVGSRHIFLEWPILLSNLHIAVLFHDAELAISLIHGFG